MWKNGDKMGIQPVNRGDSNIFEPPTMGTMYMPTNYGWGSKYEPWIDLLHLANTWLVKGMIVGRLSDWLDLNWSHLIDLWSETGLSTAPGKMIRWEILPPHWQALSLFATRALANVRPGQHRAGMWLDRGKWWGEELRDLYQGGNLQSPDELKDFHCLFTVYTSYTVHLDIQ